MIRVENFIYRTYNRIRFDTTESGTVFATIHFNEDKWTQITGQAAIDLGMRVDPSIFEGNPKFKFAKNAWAFHNLIAHPLMQIFCLFGFYKLGLKIHDKTIPRPINK